MPGQIIPRHGAVARVPYTSELKPFHAAVKLAAFNEFANAKQTSARAIASCWLPNQESYDVSTACSLPYENGQSNEE